jgi:hypothetical protein
MNSFRSIFTTLAFASMPLVILGCATAAKTTFEYREPDPIVISNEATVDDEFENVWDKLVRQLAKGFYVVNNIEKDSRLINVSFATSNPEEYVDCGETFRTFTQGSKVENLTYEVAASSSYKEGGGMDVATGMNAIIHHVDRSTSLEGRINIYIAPNENRTDISVNVRYIVSIQVSGQTTAENSAGKIVQSQLLQITQPAPISFNTNQSNKTAEGMSCVSKGVLEREILAMAGSS